MNKALLVTALTTLLLAPSKPNASLEQIVPVGETRESEKREGTFYERISAVRKYALQKKGPNLFYFECPYEVDGRPFILHLRMDYLKERFRLLVYLDENSWYDFKGLSSVDVVFFSKERTAMSVKQYEVNVNHNSKTVTYMPLEERLLENDYLTKELLNEILRRKRTLKTKISKAKWAYEIIKTVMDYETKQRIIEIGNLIAGDHVWLSRFQYQGYGWLDLTGNERAPKLFELEIERGEKSIVGVWIRTVVRDYKTIYFFKGELGTLRQESWIEAVIPLPLDKIIPGFKYEYQVREEWEKSGEKSGEDD